MKTTEICAGDIGSEHLSSWPFIIHQDVFCARDHSWSRTPGAVSQWRIQKRDEEDTRAIIAAAWSTTATYNDFLVRQKVWVEFSQNNDKPSDLQINLD